MKLQTEGEKIVKYLNLLIEKGLTKGTGGNISIYNEKEKLVAISPSSVPYNILKPEDIMLVDLDGKVADGNPQYVPSSETGMHLKVYKGREDIKALIHTHSIYCTTISCLREPLKAVDYMLAITGTHEVKCAEYAMFGTPELAENAFEAMRGAKACLLANHGVNVGAIDIENAFAITEYVEFCAELYVKARSIGNPVILSKEEIDRHIAKFGSYCKL